MRKPKVPLLSSAQPVGGPDLYFQGFQMASIPTLICDPQGAILEVNQALTLLLGYRSEELRKSG